MLGSANRLEWLDPAALLDEVSPTTWARGAEYANDGRVRSLRWDEAEWSLTASVIGQGAQYETTVYLEDDDDRLVFVSGECSCPVGDDCKHVVAVLLAATGARTGDLTESLELPAVDASPPATDRAISDLAPPSPGWEQPLRALVSARALPVTGQPLAIELRLIPARPHGSGAPQLMARLMRPGARGGWVNGSLDWGGLDSWQVREGGYREEHLALVRELTSICRPHDAFDGYMYAYRRDRQIELTACDSAQLWSLLGEAARRGLTLIHARPDLGEIMPAAKGELVFDVRRDEAGGAGSQIAVVLRADGPTVEHLVPVSFLGASAHGLVCAHRTDVEAGPDLEHWRLQLVQLAGPTAPALMRMLLSGERLSVPDADITRFANELCPALQQIAPVTSSDDSFAAPAVSEPMLVLRAQHGPGPLVTLDWEWEYAVGEALHRTRLTAERDDGLGFRDHRAEQAQLSQIVLDEPHLREAGLLDGSGRPAAGARVTLTGLDSLSTVTDILPRFADRLDFAVRTEGEPLNYCDVGDSLAVGVSTTEIDGERDWFDLGVTITVAGREVPFLEVFSALARGETQMLLDDGAYFSLDDPRLESLRELIHEARELVDVPGSSLRISRYQGGLWSELTDLGVVTEQAERWREAMAPLMGLEELATCDPPRTLVAQMRPYQQEGLSWLASLWNLGLGGVLADDMGLGKTLQTLALICHARERDPDVGPFLIVTPTSVAPNWAAEAARFAPQLSVDVVLDTLTKSGRAITDIATADVVITTYTLFRLDADAHAAVKWAGLILDEAQFVKNHRGKTYRCARELDAPFKLAVTGTPMENNLMELWALLSLTAPGLFPSPDRFAEHYVRPIERGRDSERLARLRRRIKPLIKRRTKELVATELPAKQEQTLEVKLHPRHRKVYDTYLARERQRVLHLLGDFEHNRIMILRSITRLRQLSLHPALVDAQHDSIPCAKLDALVEQLSEVAATGHRAIVFSQFTTFLKRVRARLQDEGIDFCYLDGRTRRRGDVLERFRSEPNSVFLISLKAGGVGLNLTEADYCFLLDPWWNPATEAQAIDRIHRIGQTRQVMAYRLIAQDTIEEKVRALAERKAELFHGVVDEGDLFSGAITADDIRGLIA